MKNRKLILLFVLPCLFLLFSFNDCKTIFTVVDCDNNPVAGASIVVERCSDKKIFGTSTDSNGQGTINLCRDEICNIKVTCVGYANLNVGDNCKGDNCTIKICSE